ncbi:hypothetical protein ABL78_8211 [Leptomonas seymouri]|uniref:Uncharacterized protein n=1 Tax=Leptomonas seymouri TaxID=5684 RepID=A0A0N1HSZ3_LEPSE|nr:hypothetical protein ABL78_8211 [Leptomonas seymouri]|eukprot:KPI82774.1 hypothetical protein ABL78_8211 [Leptomonas seymouri]
MLMPTAPPSLPQLSLRVNGAAAQPLEDVKLHFVMEEVRKRFVSVSTSEMLEVLGLLLTDKRIMRCEEESASAILNEKSPQDGNLEPNGVLELLRKNSGALAQLQSSMNSSVTASELSPRDWGSMMIETNEGALRGSPTARLNCEWKKAITFILDHARQLRQPHDENYTVKQLVQASIAEWLNRSGETADNSQASPVDVRRGRSNEQAWLGVMAKVRGLAEGACYKKYELQYAHLHNEADNDNEDGTGASACTPCDDDSAMSPPSGVARRSTHRSAPAAGGVGIPPFSLVILCSRPPKQPQSAKTAQDVGGAKAAAQKGDVEDESSTCLVVGCEWFQWVFLVQCPVACQGKPYPMLSDGCTEAEAAAVRLEQRQWRQRYCTVQLLYPSEAGFSSSPDSGSDLRSADAEYELSEPQVVLSSLLGVAMRVWCQSHPHLVAEVFQLEEDTYPQHLYDGASFWSQWPIRDLRMWQQCETAGSSDSMPIPLLPGECFANDSDLEGGDEEEDSESAN